ncbi:retinoic acid early-inducible protein 1-epsilon-like, partial [Microtus ochrogaster]|uniref:Retinoic acid early-inducible protein 1-epsilon-like n=1 Tax=Microtus ochrogaster TaxID=79684 RepID=A0ABM1AZ26_MICOH
GARLATRAWHLRPGGEEGAVPAGRLRLPSCVLLLAAQLVGVVVLTRAGGRGEASSAAGPPLPAMARSGEPAPVIKPVAQGMAKKAVAKHCLSTQALCSSILRIICLWSMLLADANSLTCNVIVKAGTTPGQPWCEGQCSVDEEPLLQYKDSKFTPLGDLGNAANGTQVWMDMSQKLEYLWKELRKMLANTKKEITKINGQPTLQSTMLSQYEHGQIVGASWKFNISGMYTFILNTMNMNWTLIDHEASGIMNTWKDDEHLIKDLKTISTADCSYWLKELLKYQKEKPTLPTASPDVVQPSSMAIKTNISVPLIILTCLLLNLLL